MPRKIRGRNKRSRREFSSVPAVPGESSSPVIDASGEGEEEVDPIADDIGSDSESDDDFHVEDDIAPQERSVAEVIADASATRISAVTRQLYDSHMRQMAVWCSQNDRVRCYVGADGNMLVPLRTDAVVLFTEHLMQKKVPWPHAEVPGSKKHLAVKTVSNFFSAVNFSFTLCNERVPQDLAQFFYNSKKSYTLKIARLKDAGLHPDKTNSIGVNFSVYERICVKLGSYVAHFKGSCYSCWRDLWLFWVLLFNLLGRCFQVSKMCYDWIWWQDDALVVKVPTQKGALIYHTPPI